VRIAAALALAAALATPVQAQRQCVTPVEAESLALVALPEVIQEAGRVCATALPAASLLRRTSGPFLAKYVAEADRAWPAARAAIAKVTDPSAALLLQSDYARPLLATLIVPQLLGRVEQRDCATIDRFVTLLASLPPRNVAGVVVTTLTWLKAERARGKRVDVPDLPICPAAGAERSTPGSAAGAR